MINSFKSEYRFLSNFYMLEYPIHWRGINFPSSEHFYQAMKTMDYNLRLQISQLPTPGKTKRLGSKLQLREDWDMVKDTVMEIGVMLKFTMNTHLGNKLIATADKVLIEGNWWHDNYWGNCNCTKCVKWPGLNKLGHILMNTRQKLLTIG